MGILSNFIGGAAEAGGNILQRQRESDVDLQKQQQYAKYNDDLARAREQTTMELRKQYEQERDQYLASPEYLEMQAKAEAAKATAKVDTDAALIPKRAANAAAEFDAGKGTRDAAQKERLSFALEEFRQKSAADLEVDIARMNDPRYLAGKEKEAAAGRDPNSASLARVQLEAAQLALDEKKAEMKMPPAVKAQAEAWREQVKAKTAIIDKAVAEGSATPEGLKSLEAQRDMLNKKVEDIYRPYLGDKAPKTDDKPAAPAAVPNAAALDYLRKNPNMRSEFIAKYGEAALPKADSGKADKPSGPGIISRALAPSDGPRRGNAPPVPQQIETVGSRGNIKYSFAGKTYDTRAEAQRAANKQ